MASKEGSRGWGEFLWNVSAIVLLLGALAVGAELLDD